MITHPIAHEQNYYKTIPMIDGEFDHFEVNTDLEMQLREAETANLYHDALNEEE